MQRESIWKDASQTEYGMGLNRPTCTCGCCEGKAGAGFLQGSDNKGNVFEIWIENEEVFRLLNGVLRHLDELLKDSKLPGMSC